MGFSHDEIIAIITGSPLAQPAPEQTPAPVPAAPAPGQDLTQVLDQLSNLNGNIGQLVQSIQAGNIINSRNTVPQPESVDDVMAQILNPRTNEPIGGNN